MSSVNFTCGHHEDEEDSVSGSSVSSVVTLDPVTAKDDGIRCRCSAKWLPEITQYSQTEEVVLNVTSTIRSVLGYSKTVFVSFQRNFVNVHTDF